MAVNKFVDPFGTEVQAQVIVQQIEPTITMADLSPGEDDWRIRVNGDEIFIEQFVNDLTWISRQEWDNLTNAWLTNGNINIQTNYLDLDGIVVPANPGVGVRRLFVDTATGEISVRTSAGTTVSLESGGGGGNAFTTITPTSGDVVVADQVSDNLTLTAGTGITITGVSVNDTITIATNMGLGTLIDNRIVRANGTSSLQNSGISISDTDELQFTTITNRIFENGPNNLTVEGNTSTTFGKAGDILLGDGVLRILRPNTDGKMDVGSGSFQFNDGHFLGQVNCLGGIRTKHVENNVANPPTNADLDTAFGLPATLGNGFVGIVNDNTLGTDVWLCTVANDVDWYYQKLTKAL